MKIAIIVPVFNPGVSWPAWLQAVDEQSITFSEKIIVDSSSNDGYVEPSTQHGFNITVIPQSEFDHGGTRQLALDHIGDSEFVVFLTQDAILQDKDSVHDLLKAFDDDEVAVTYGRQLPRNNATPIESHARLFNYPNESHVYSLRDKERQGLKVAYNSNSYSAYRVSAIKKIGGFRSNVIFGEDMIVAAEALKKHYKVAYCHLACVYHSHAYSIKQEFQRYFDMGVMHQTQSWLLNEFGKPTGEGFRFVKSEFRYLLKHAFWRVPEAFIRTLAKFVGYKTGIAYKCLPLFLKRAFSMNKRYWRS